ncbi:hypothetical protein J4E91_001088 [Alternaria rosae]|nr:hypothetical protein J4E91_001088 [Alternaria rosae]
MLAVPEIMDHPRFSTVRKSQTEVTGITLVAPHHDSASVSKIHGPLEMFFNCVGALFYVMNRDDVQSDIEAIKAAGNENIPLGNMFSNGSTIRIRTYAAELAGMAAIGVIHSQLADPMKAPPPELADYFYAVAKHGLDSAILYDPFRAMNVCALLGMYNIVVKATVALAYIELGLSLPRNRKICLEKCPPDWSPAYYDDIRRTHTTLVHLQCWLNASLDYSSDSLVFKVQSSLDGLDVPPEDMIRRECVKVSIIKASLLHRLPSKAPVPESITLEFRAQLSRFHAQLPSWMSVAALLGGDNSSLMATFRPVIFYVHLFYLSAMMLLSRRLIIAYIPLDAAGIIVLPPEARRAIEEGYQAAELNASVMSLMLQEGKVVQVCWLCIYTAYTAGVMIAHQASQKALNNEPFTNDVELLGKCIGVLEYCAIKDTLAEKFRSILAAYLKMLQGHKLTMGDSGDFATPPTSSSSDSLFIFHRGSSKLHVAALGLLQTIQRPFSGLKDVATTTTLSNRAETSMGTHLEWEYELKNRDGSEAPQEEHHSAHATDDICEPTKTLCSSFEQDHSSQKLPVQPSEEAWTKWTPATWQSSFNTSPK